MDLQGRWINFNSIVLGISKYTGYNITHFSSSAFVQVSFFRFRFLD